MRKILSHFSCNENGPYLNKTCDNLQREKSIVGGGGSANLMLGSSARVNRGIMPDLRWNLVFCSTYFLISLK